MNMPQNCTISHLKFKFFPDPSPDKGEDFTDLMTTSPLFLFFIILDLPLITSVTLYLSSRQAYRTYLSLFL